VSNVTVSAMKVMGRFELNNELGEAEAKGNGQL